MEKPWWNTYFLLGIGIYLARNYPKSMDKPQWSYIGGSMFFKNTKKRPVSAPSYHDNRLHSFAMVVPHPHRKGTCSTTTSFNIHQKRSVAEWRSCSVILIIYSITPRKLTNVPLKKGPFPKERMNCLPTIIFQGRVVSFFGRSTSHIPNSWTIFGPMIPGE